jgi:hypothetical protein
VKKNIRILPFLLVLLFFLALLKPASIFAECACNWSHCLAPPSGRCSSNVDANKYTFYGSQYKGSGCAETDICSITLASGGLATTACGYCPYGYGAVTSTDYDYFSICAPSCDGSVSCTAGETTCRTDCLEAETGQGQGACAVGQIACLCDSGGSTTNCVASGGHTEYPVVCGINGFYGRTYNDVTGSTYTKPIAEIYSCAPNGSVIGGRACYGYYANRWTGYLNVPQSGNYEFRVKFQRSVSVQIDVNGNGVFDDAATCSTGDNLNRYGDAWYFLNGSDRGPTYRPTQFGGLNSSCWITSGVEACDEGRHWQNADSRGWVTAVWNAITNRTDIVSSSVPANYRGTTECPVSVRNYADEYSASTWSSNGTGYSFFTRTLSAGSHMMELFLHARYGDAEPYSHTLSFSYRRVGDSTWVDLDNPTTYPGGVCPITSCEAASEAWWQVKDGDVTTNGSIGSTLPASTGIYFNEAGSGGYPGVPMYGGSINLTASNVSETGWMANSAASSAKMYNSSFFINSIPADVVINTVPSSSVDGSFFESGGTASYGYYWYVYDATSTGIDLSINSAANLGTRKVILIVKGASLNIGGSINLTDGSGFFLGVSSANINVASTVGGSGSADLEGVYVADLSFTTGTGGTSTDSQLWLRGTVAAFGGISLQRDLGGSANAASPAEYFEYAPDQELLFPTKLSVRPSAWREVAP